MANWYKALISSGKLATRANKGQKRGDTVGLAALMRGKVAHNLQYLFIEGNKQMAVSACQVTRPVCIKLQEMSVMIGKVQT